MDVLYGCALLLLRIGALLVLPLLLNKAGAFPLVGSVSEMNVKAFGGISVLICWYLKSSQNRDCIDAVFRCGPLLDGVRTSPRVEMKKSVHTGGPVEARECTVKDDREVSCS